MKSQSLLRGLLVLCMLVCGQANALNYTYSGPAFTSPPGGYFNASIDVTSNANGSYEIGAGLTSITLSVGGWSSPATPTSLSLTEPSLDVYENGTNSVSFLDGVVDQWFLDLTFVDPSTSETYRIFTRRQTDLSVFVQGYEYDDPSDAIDSLFVFNQYFRDPNDTTNTPPPQGTWREGSSVPEPATLSLIGLALVGIGVSRRRKQK